MEYLFKKLTFLALFFSLIVSAFAQESPNVKKIADEIVAKYNETPGVDCISVVKGGGLGVVKMMLNKQLGKSFMNGVTSITVINYSEASQQVCESLRKDLDLFLSVLKEFDLSKEKDFSKHKFLRCFAYSSKPEVLSDFVMAVEDGQEKMILYMAGEITVDSK